MICATYDASGVVKVISPPPAEMSSCALLIPTYADQENNPFVLSASDGYAVALAIALVWGTGFAARALIRTVNQSSGVSENE